jgi:peptidoglycan/xylan/chitin deacetylase (PgdA/CDA1 family)
MRYCFLRYPDGKLKAVTLSYDDGVRADLKLCEILEKYGMKCTFNINSGNIGANANKMTADEIRDNILAKGHEVAVHGERHMAPGIAFPHLAIRDIQHCREALEEEFDIIVRGMAYPDSGITKMHNGNNYPMIREYIKDLGIVYSRTLGADHNRFLLP